MNGFNEQNSVEHFIIHCLTGVNLNENVSGILAEPQVEYETTKWKYISGEMLERDSADVLLEKELSAALCRLNPEIATQPERAEEVIHKLRAILVTVSNVGLVRANEEFSRWLRGEHTLPFGKNDAHVPVRLIDFEKKQNNSYIIANQVSSKLWEALSPDEMLNPYQQDYKWLSQVYISVRPVSSDTGRLLWHALGAQTTKLIHDNIKVSGIVTDMEEIVLDADVIDNLMNNKDTKQAQKLVTILFKRFANHKGILKFKELSERLEELRNRAEKGLINSIEFIKQLCQLAKETLQAEKETNAATEQKNARAALTELFLEMKTDQTPVIVERIVNDIDEIVRIVRFDGWQLSTTGEKAVKRELRKILWVKYPIKDEELFNKAYEYIKEYY